MARRALGPATLEVVRAVEAVATGPVLVACSGGPDSLALAAAAGIVAARSGLGVRAAVVDHGLQPGSDAVAAAVAHTLAGLGLEVVVLPVVVDRTGTGIEAAARGARYAALSAAAAPDELVLLGHTLDDQAETVLLGLARGSGTRSLAGMPTRRDGFVRPLLGVRAETTRAACTEMKAASTRPARLASRPSERARLVRASVSCAWAWLRAARAEASWAWAGR